MLSRFYMSFSIPKMKTYPKSHISEAEKIRKSSLSINEQPKNPMK